jgi:hypothetical protein
LGVLNSQLFFGSYSIFINESPRDYYLWCFVIKILDYINGVKNASMKVYG